MKVEFASRMKLSAGLHLAYCTNVHRGETWAETFDSLNQYTLRVRERVCPKQPYGIGLRLSQQAAEEGEVAFVDTHANAVSG